MILSIDLNPVLKRKYIMDTPQFYEINYARDQIYGPGGDGIELAYLLRGLNADVIISGFLGGVNGSHIHKALLEESIVHEFLPIKDESSDNIILSTNEEELIVNSKAPRITRDELGGFLELYNRLIKNVNIICCSGDLPSNLPGEIYFDIVANANILNKKTMLGIGGDNLRYGLEASPYLALLNKEELENLTKLKLDYEYEIIKAGLYIIDKGVQIAVISLGNKGSIVLTPENVFRVDSPEVEIDKDINYGYMLGGFAYALQKNYDFDLMLNLGQACGIINCFNHREAIDMSDVKRIMGMIDVSRFSY